MTHTGNRRFSIIPARAADDPRLSDGALRTLAAIGTFGDKNGWCFPGYMMLAKMRGISKQAISKHIAELVRLGYLNVTHRYDPQTGAQRASLLQIRFDFPYEESGELEAEDEGVNSRLTGGQPPVDGGSTSEVDGGSTSEVDGGSTSEVDGGSTSEVDAINENILTRTINETINGGGVVKTPSTKKRVNEQNQLPPPPPIIENQNNIFENKIISEKVVVRKISPSVTEYIQKSNLDDAESEKRYSATAIDAEALYRKVRPSHFTVPRSEKFGAAMDILIRYLENHKGDLEAAAEALRPYAEEADKRNISQLNLCWLTEWAAAGVMPKSSKKNGHEEHGLDELQKYADQWVKRNATTGNKSRKKK